MINTAAGVNSDAVRRTPRLTWRAESTAGRISWPTGPAAAAICRDLGNTSGRTRSRDFRDTP